MNQQEQLIASIRQEQIDQILKDAGGDILQLSDWKRGLLSQLVQDQQSDLTQYFSDHSQSVRQ